MITAAQGPQAALTPSEAELFRCPPPPVLPEGAVGYEDVLAVALRLRAALDTCRDMDSRLIELATRPATASAH
ncbi:conserved protein of unknown function (plasmid) [Rhodovastum atsumiense]|uniref:Uncharacterized protein n=1 Tax=Rhodovastum atsumiense TaxID=504468 RepID=A0A5M6IU96_9PROT|nr:hypothetical protein [Rhodovastum atsumiense]KAA5611896.1 hypothetical protein F1189_12760 [Rhodovastum atsumiense]CAH2606124.1 conserved protein of unknown function [Rhodovastum atsumiense]